MFFVKYLDQKQGEARVVDQNQLIRQRLSAFLERRPSWEQLIELGILGRQERFGLAQQVVDELLRSRLKAQEEELARPPAGERSYSAQMLQQLQPSGERWQAQLQRLKQLHQMKQQEMKATEKRWQEAAAECQRQSCSPAVPQLVKRLQAAVQLLSQHRDLKAGPLASVFAELQDFQKLLLKRRALENIVSMAEKTDAAREAVFSYGSECQDIHILDLLELCAQLPPRSKAVGMKRLRFIMEPLRRNLTQELAEQLQRIWPKEPNSKVPATVPGRVLELCRLLAEAQRVERELRKAEAAEAHRGSLPLSSDDWPSEALAAPLVARFRHHFCRADSDLCRMDKPEWAFRYLTDLLSDHLAELDSWGASQLSEGLCQSLAQEARLFLRLRMPLLAKDEGGRTLLYQTLQQLVKFHASMQALGGESCTQVLMKDFDTNRPLEEVSSPSPTRPREGSLIAARLARAVRGREEELPLGFLDVFTSADASFIAEKLESALQSSAWRVQPVDAKTDGSPEIFALGTLLPDLLERAAERCACLATEVARRSYCNLVLAPGLRQSATALKQRWNDLADPLKAPQEVDRLLETLQELCVFLDGFSLAKHIVTACDELRELQVLIRKKLLELQAEDD